MTFNSLVVDFLQDFQINWVKLYGPIYRFWRGSQPVVALSSPEAVEVLSI